MGEVGVGRGMGAGLDDYDDDEHEPCSKKIMPALFAWYFTLPQLIFSECLFNYM